jgi:hypothetical protein
MFEVSINDGIVTMSVARYEELLEREDYANALDAGGVDNWEWYSEALEAAGYFEEEETECLKN